MNAVLTDSTGNVFFFFFLLTMEYRFNHVYRFLDIPFQDIAVLTPSKL